MCGRKVELSVEDHGYDPQAGGGHLPVARAQGRRVPADARSAHHDRPLEDINTTDKVLTSVTLWPSKLLGQPYMFITGSTYDIETISAIDFLMTDKGLEVR